MEASKISKNKKIRNYVDKIQIKLANNPPGNFKGSCLDGRDITYKILPNADLKFFINAKLRIRAKRRFKELKKLDTGVKYSEVYKSIKLRDRNDKNRRISPLRKTKDSIYIDTSKLTINKCFLKIKKIIDKKLIENNTKGSQKRI